MFERLDVNEIQSFFKLINVLLKQEDTSVEEKDYLLSNINKIHCLSIPEELFNKTLDEKYNITINFENNKIKMIRFLRTYTSMSLKDCKEFVENCNDNIYNIITPYYSFAVLIRTALQKIDLEYKLTVDVEEDEE